MPEYKTEPLVVSVVSGILPESERNRRVALTSFGSASSKRPEVPQREVVCYECGRVTPVPAAALSGKCAHCNAHLRMTDAELRPGSKKLTIRTLGDVTLPADAVLSQLSIVCRNFTFYGRGSGTFRCSGTMRVNSSNRIEGSVQAGCLVVARGAELILAQGATVDKLEVYGRVSGRIVAREGVTLHRGAALYGDCYAPSLSLASGATHRGEWFERQPE